MRNLVFAALNALAVLAPAQAAAQTMRAQSTPIVIHDAQAGGEGVVLERQQIIQRQRVTTIRAVQLQAPIARPSESGRQREGFPAGERLFGIYDDYDSWAYCALREGFFGDRLTCYLDTDDDGRLDLAKPSGAPFLGIPFFIFAEGAETRPLESPAAYSRIPYADGPAIEAGLRATLTEARTRRGETTPGRISLEFGYIVENRFIPVTGSSQSAPFTGAPVQLRVRDALVEFSGAAVRGQLGYRVLEAMPAQIDRVEMTRTVTYGTTYVPVYIPR
ncbi:MAG: hypothetical protein J0L81_15885 [Caulobacterales bacterium]|jgi:hypothetical protein|nr:hypothetical protein [Caulobacterales bacterium]